MDEGDENEDMETRRLNIRWNDKEEILLAEAWIEHSQDNNIGKDQRDEIYWNKIIEDFHDRTTGPVQFWKEYPKCDAAEPIDGDNLQEVFGPDKREAELAGSRQTNVLSTTNGQGQSEEERGDIITSSSSGNEKALASLMVNEYAMINESYKVKRTQNREVFLEIRKRELELKAQELAVQEYEQCLKDEMFYMKSIDHLTVLQHDKMNEMKRTIKAMLNSKESPWQGFAAALAVLVTGASQSRQHESRKSPTKSFFDVVSRRISIVTVNTKEYHSDVLAIITRIMRRTY
ncbi:hypothetical protein Tco_1285646 [Tanacetum coccineum]